MDIATKIGVVVAFAGIGIALLDIFLAEDLKQMARWVRLCIAGVGMLMLIGGAGTVAFWPTPVPGLGPRLDPQPPQAFYLDGKMPFANIYVKNDGDRPAIAFTRSAGMFPSKKPLSAKEEDDLFALMLKRAPEPDVNSTSQIEVGNANTWFSIWDQTSTAADLKQIGAGAIPHYLVFLLKYVDPVTDRVVVTEHCSFLFQGVRHNCIGHNRIFQLKA